jgi:plasmid maintenance system killer protein
VEITFRTRKIKKVFDSEKELKRKYGDPLARNIQVRIAVLKNAPVLSKVPTDPPERRHQLTGNRSGQYAVVLDKQNRLVFVPYHDPIPQRADGGINTDEVTAIEIIEVTDYH